MKRHAVTLASLFLALCLGCNRSPKSAMKGQSNATLTFYGKVVDRDGRPLSGAKFEFRVEAYPKDWTFDTRGRSNDVSQVTATSDGQGCFKFTVTGCQLVRMKAEREGYRHFCDLDHETRPSNVGVSNYFYCLIAWSDLWYKSEPEHPAIFVFVKDGVREVSALPCKGGYNSGNGKHWTLSKPGWPLKPSLEDVVRKQPAIKPE